MEATAAGPEYKADRPSSSSFDGSMKSFLWSCSASCVRSHRNPRNTHPFPFSLFFPPFSVTFSLLYTGLPARTERYVRAGSSAVISQSALSCAIKRACAACMCYEVTRTTNSMSVYRAILNEDCGSTMQAKSEQQRTFVRGNFLL